MKRISTKTKMNSDSPRPRNSSSRKSSLSDTEMFQIISEESSVRVGNSHILTDTQLIDQIDISECSPCIEDNQVHENNNQPRNKDSDDNSCGEDRSYQIPNDNVEKTPACGLLMKCAREKAGMDGIDKQEIQRKIIELSKGSSFYQSEIERDIKVKNRIEQWKIKFERGEFKYFYSFSSTE